MAIALMMGTLLGFLTGLGIGGGSLLILWLTLVLGIDSFAARGIVLLFFIPAAVISSIFRWKQGTISIRSSLPAMIAGSIAAMACSYLSTMVDAHVLDRFFGIILISAGIRELLYKGKRQE